MSSLSERTNIPRLSLHKILVPWRYWHNFPYLQPFVSTSFWLLRNYILYSMIICFAMVNYLAYVLAHNLLRHGNMFAPFPFLVLKLACVCRTRQRFFLIGVNKRLLYLFSSDIMFSSYDTELCNSYLLWMVTSLLNWWDYYIPSTSQPSKLWTNWIKLKKRILSLFVFMFIMKGKILSLPWNF